MSGEIIKLNIQDSGNVFFSKVKSLIKLLSGVRPSNIRAKKSGNSVSFTYNYFGERSYISTMIGAGLVIVHQLRLEVDSSESSSGVSEYSYYLSDYDDLSFDPQDYGNGEILADGVELIEDGAIYVNIWLLYQGANNRLYIFRPDGDYNQQTAVLNDYAQLDYVHNYVDAGLDSLESSMEEYISGKLGWDTAQYPNVTVMGRIGDAISNRAIKSGTPYTHSDWFIVQNNYVSSRFFISTASLPSYVSMSSAKVLYCRRSNLILGFDAGDSSGDHKITILKLGFTGELFPDVGDGSVEGKNNYTLSTESISDVAAACWVGSSGNILLDSDNRPLIDTYTDLYFHYADSSFIHEVIQPTSLRIFPLRNGYLFTYKLSLYDNYIHVQYVSEITAIKWPSGQNRIDAKLFYKNGFRLNSMYIADQGNVYTVTYVRSTISFNDILVYIKLSSSSNSWFWDILKFTVGTPLPSSVSEIDGLTFSTCTLYHYTQIASENQYVIPQYGFCPYYLSNESWIPPKHIENMLRKWEPENAVYEIKWYTETSGYGIVLARRWFSGLYWARYQYILPVSAP